MEFLLRFFNTGSKAAVTITTVVSILGAVWAVDNHYASAADVTRIETQLSSSNKKLEEKIAAVEQEGEIRTLQLRRESLRDRIEDLYIKQDTASLTNVESRQLDRYEAELRFIDELLADAKRKSLGLPPAGGAIQYPEVRTRSIPPSFGR